MKLLALKLLVFALLVISVSNEEIDNDADVKVIESFDEIRMTSARQATATQEKEIKDVFDDLKIVFQQSKAVPLKAEKTTTTSYFKIKSNKYGQK
jgi:hypothetical protein